MMNTGVHPSRRTVLKLVGGGIGVAALATGTASAHGGTLTRELAAVRAATARYNNPANAYADGYMAPNPAFDPVNAPEEPLFLALEDVVERGEAVCEMGYHFVNLGLVGGADPLAPQGLVYGVAGKDSLVLGAVEYIVPAFDPDGNPVSPPDLFHGDDDHWDPLTLPIGPVNTLHAWVHSNNPEGVFHHSNPRSLFSPAGCVGH